MAFKDPEARRRYDAEWKRQKRAQDPESVRAAARARYKKDPEKVLTLNQKYREQHREELAAAERKRKKSQSPERQRDYRLRRAYGITLAQYNEMAERQGGACAICSRIETPLSVDHCHESGAVRGLLCKNCNKGLGMFGESVATVRVALAYMEGFSSRDTTA